MFRVQRNRMTAAEYHAVTAKPKGANATEAAFGERLRLLHRDGVITEPRFEAVKLPLLPPCGVEGTGARTYTPDWTFSLCEPGDWLWITSGAFKAATGVSLQRDCNVVVDVKGTRYTPKLRKARPYYREDAFYDIRLAACLWPSWAFFLVYRVRSGWKWERVRGGKLGGEVDW